MGYRPRGRKESDTTEQLHFTSAYVHTAGKSHGQRSLAGYRPWGRKESDVTERLHFTSLQPMFTLLGNPMDGGARRATGHGVAKS